MSAVQQSAMMDLNDIRMATKAKTNVLLVSPTMPDTRITLRVGAVVDRETSGLLPHASFGYGRFYVATTTESDFNFKLERRTDI